MEPKVYGVSVKTENEVARATLKSMGITIGTQTREQKEYAKSWEL
jgi:S-adenosylhomocysteine hydrolase